MKVDKLEPKPAPRAWLVYPENPEDDKRPKIRWVLKSTEGRVDIAGLTKKGSRSCRGVHKRDLVHSMRGRKAERVLGQ